MSSPVSTAGVLAVSPGRHVSAHAVLPLGGRGQSPQPALRASGTAAGRGPGEYLRVSRGRPEAHGARPPPRGAPAPATTTVWCLRAALQPERVWSEDRSLE